MARGILGSELQTTQMKGRTMPKSPKEKRLGAIERSEAAIALWKLNKAEIDPEIVQGKIAKHETLITNTKAALNRY